MKKKIAVLYGGRSCEHDISVITGVQAAAELDVEKYEVMRVYMTDGAFYIGEPLSDMEFYGKKSLKKLTRVYLTSGEFHTKPLGVPHKRFKPDVALVCCHGGEGENGILQGLLEFNGIPYTSTGVLASAMAMDKSSMKEHFSGLLYNSVEGITVRRADVKSDVVKTVMHLETFLDYPMIVKPSNLGSSIGIRIAQERDELTSALETASAFDGKILVEHALLGFTELNCAAYSDGESLTVSEVEEPISWNFFLTFEDKYVGGEKGTERRLPAEISEELRAQIKDTTQKLYADLGLFGVVRVDYLLSAEGKLYVNEINTIPGSLAYYLFEPLGVSYGALLDAIIKGAQIRAAESRKNRLSYDSGVLKKVGVFGKHLRK